MEGIYDYFMLTNLIICQLTSTSNHLIDPGGGLLCGTDGDVRRNFEFSP